MIHLSQSLAAWGSPEFDAALKAELAALGSELPLQAGLTAGSYAVEDSVEVVILSTAATSEAIEVKAMLFYQSLTPGCACAGDPTVESEQTEQVTVRVEIHRATAEAKVARVRE